MFVTTNVNECSDKRISEMVHILEKDESPWVDSLPVVDAADMSTASTHIVMERDDNVAEEERSGTKNDVNSNQLVHTPRTEEVTWKEGSTVYSDDPTEKLKNSKNLLKIFYQNIRA